MLTPELHAALDKLHALPGCGVGGPFHIVTDDINVETHHIVWCLAGARDWHGKFSPQCDWDRLRLIIEAVACELLDLPGEAEREAALEAWWNHGTEA